MLRALPYALAIPVTGEMHSMLDINLDDAPEQIFLKTPEGEEFLPLGAHKAADISAAAQARIAGERADEPTIWGTLGMVHPDDTDHLRRDKGTTIRSWKGKIQFSRIGSFDSTATDSGEATMEEIADVYAGRHEEINQGDDKKVVERYISLEDVDFTEFPDEFTWDENPRLHECSGRDRLHYEIPIVPRESLRESASDREHKTFYRSSDRSGGKLVIKALVFHRGNSTSLQVVRRLADKLSQERHNLLHWNQEYGCFVPLLNPQRARDSQRALLLLHGTFSSTEGSFANLSARGAKSWIGRLAGTSRYDQILAFDHSTILHGTQENAAALLSAIGGPFKNPFDVLTHSRGGLVARELALGNYGLALRRGALVASANGVGYFATGRRVAKFLSITKSILKGAGRPVGAFVTGLAQHSAMFFLNLPGPRVMTLGSVELSRLIGRPWPHNAAPPTFLPIVGDYDRSVVASERLLKRLAMNGLDLVIKAFLGRHHDWVVGTREQAIYLPGRAASGCTPENFRDYMIPARHRHYYGLPQVQNLLWSFLY